MDWLELISLTDVDCGFVINFCEVKLDFTMEIQNKRSYYSSMISPNPT